MAPPPSKPISIVLEGDYHTGKRTCQALLALQPFPVTFIPHGEVLETSAANLAALAAGQQPEQPEQQGNSSTKVALIHAEPGGGGEEQDHDGLRTMCYHGADLFLLFFSVANRHSFERVSSKWVGFLRRHEPVAAGKRKPWLLVGTYCDKRPPRVDMAPGGSGDGAQPSAREDSSGEIEIGGAGGSSVDAASCVAWEEGEALARSIGASAYVEISALTGAGMAQLAKVLCEHVAMAKATPRVRRCVIL